MCAVVFRSTMLAEGRLHSVVREWASELVRLPDLGAPLASGQTPNSETVVVHVDDVLCYLRLHGRWLEYRAAAHARADLESAEQRIRELVPQPNAPRDEAPSSFVRFWCHSHGYASAEGRRIRVPTWDSICGNYPTGAAHQLEPLMRGFVPGTSGRLLLWHGPPGTGKTFALRALTWQWRDWCDAHYVIDPERFFGTDPDYMREVLLEHLTDPTGMLDTAEHTLVGLDTGRWRLLILEDTGELLVADAKERAGQGLSRLLNLTDGLLGQGLRTLVLVTGNEPIGRLHQAVARPGRCAADVDFGPFDAIEANAWLARRGMAERSKGGPLADLYAAAQGRGGRATRRFGFAT